MTANLPQTLPQTDYDAIVVGSGAAGLYAALCLPPAYRVGLISKEPLSLSASDWAQGGIAAAIAPDDSPSFHLEDTLVAGAGLCEVEAVKFLVEQAPRCIQSLVKMGVAFDRHGSDLALTLEAAHSHRRVLHAADTTGRAVVTALTEQVLQRPNIQVLPQVYVLNLWLHSGTGRCQGICAVIAGEIRWLRAGAVVLATGGGGQVFAQTTNPELSTGDGVAIAYRAGVLLRDLEFFQFHPTALMKPNAPHFLISEAVRGEGAHLVDSQGDRFAFEYHPAGELAPRDVVSRAIFNHLQKTGEPNVWLDLRPIPPETIQHRFPNIIQTCLHWGIDVFSEPIPVAPAAHYWMGGIVTDTASRTTLPGLYAVGETASTGVHGANRLASNSLLECIVFGAQLAQVELSPPDAMEMGDQQVQKPELALAVKLPFTVDAIRQLMWQQAGICRTASGLAEAIAQIEEWQQKFAQLPLSQFLSQLQPGQGVRFNETTATQTLRFWSETRNLLEIARLILKSAAFRTESRGGHFRSDFPDASSNWQAHTLVQKNLWQKS